MTRLCFLLRSLDFGGVERQLVTLATTLSEREYDISILCFYAEGTLASELEHTGVRLICLAKRGRWDVVGFSRRLVHSLRMLQPDVLQAYLAVPNLLTILLKPFFPGQKMIWGLGSSNINWRSYDWFVSLTQLLERLFSRFADLIIVNSHAGYAYHARHGYPARRMVVIQNGFDTEKFQPDRAAGQKVRAEWGVAEGELLIGLIGRLDPMKDHPNFLRAAALLRRKFPGARFVCVGAGPEGYRKSLADLTAELHISDKVIWADARSDINAVHNALDVACSSSSGEGLPNVIGEAMACGVPCVVTDVGDSARLVGDTGIVVPPANPEALAQGWALCLQRNREELGRRARARILQEFSVSRLVAETESAIRLLVSTAASR